MKTKLVFGGLIVLVLAFLVWFGIGGGFANVEVEKEKEYVLTIYGKSFEGSLKSKEVSKLFSEVEESFNGKAMYVCYDGIPSKENEYTVKMTVGGLESFEGAEKEVISLQEVYKARHDSHYMLNKAQTQILNIAKEDGVELNLTKMIEVYYTKNDIEVVIPVLSK